MYIYIGEGKFIPGVPAKNLTDEQAKAYGVTNSPLWKKAKKKSDDSKDTDRQTAKETKA